MLLRHLLVLFLLLPLPDQALAEPSVLRHDLQITLRPEAHSLSGIDRLSVAPDGASRLTFALAPQAEIHRVTVAGKEVPRVFRDGKLTIELPPDARAERIMVEISYLGVFADEAPSRPANTEDPSYGVAGTIGSQGAFLGGGAAWYPEIPGSRPQVRLEVLMPAGMTAVTSGRLVASAPGRVVWEGDHPVQGIALAAGPYRRHRGQAGKVPIYAFFYPQSEQFAKTYLKASEEYLRLYQELFGFYPFEKFAVAENFFPTGYGFPSWTLLGSTVVRLPFIVATSLGHEIAHSWWGNGVWVDYSRGNWSEGLTTYVADHLYKERESADEARDYRLKILRDYATLVPPDQELPLAEFISRTSAAEQAIGYGKAAMVFHMARQWVGDEAFWAGLRVVARKKLFQQAAWEDFAAALGKSSGQSMDDFFRQWIDRPGAPVLALAGIRRERIAKGWRVTGVLRQEEPVFRLRVPVRLETVAGAEEALVEMRGEEARFQFRTDAEPRRLIADPESDVFRRLGLEEIPPAVNGLRGSESLLVVAASGLPAEILEAARAILPAMGQPQARVVSDNQIEPADLRGHDVLFLGIPDRRDLLPPLPEGLRVAAEGFSLMDQEYAGENASLFAALPHPSDAGRVTGIFFPGSVAAAESAARKIPHYGKYSYLAFVEGTNVAKGVWPVPDSPLVHAFTPINRGDRQ